MNIIKQDRKNGNLVIPNSNGSSFTRPFSWLWSSQEDKIERDHQLTELRETREAQEELKRQRRENEKNLGLDWLRVEFLEKSEKINSEKLHLYNQVITTLLDQTEQECTAIISRDSSQEDKDELLKDQREIYVNRKKEIRKDFGLTV